MFTTAAHIIETYSAQTYTSFVEDRIFTPLGMSSSTFSPAKAGNTGRFTQGWTSTGRLLPECFTEEMATLMAGAGGVISSAVDMAGAFRLRLDLQLKMFVVIQSKWVALWLNKGVHNNVAVIPLSVYGNASQSYSLSISVSDDPELSVEGYGMGWFRHSYLGHDVTNVHPLLCIMTDTGLLDRIPYRFGSRILHASLVPSKRRCWSRRFCQRRR